MLFLLIALPSLFALVFAGLSFYFYTNQQKTKIILLERDEIQKRRIYEISILKAIQDRIGYSLNTQHVVDTITTSLKGVFSYSSASALIVEEGKVIFKTFLEERVSSMFIEQVKKSMLASLASLSDNPLPEKVEEIRQGVAVDETNSKILASFFHIPIVVNGKTVGLVNVSSTQPGLYKEADMTIMYQMTNQASTALSKLQEVIETEEGKLLAMITSLADGIFMIDSTNQLTLINQTAKKLLAVQSQQPTIFEVVSALSRKYDFGSKLQEVMQKNKAFEDKDFALGENSIQIVITPVLGPSTDTNTGRKIDKVIGASVTMHDNTLEKSLAKVKEDFTSSIVHELRSPLTAIKAGSELMLTEKEKLDPTQQEKLMEIIHKQSNRMLKDINSLLDAAKLESGHFAILQKITSVADVCEEVVEFFMPEAREKHIALLVDVDSNLPRGYFDGPRIEQVITNLISNSLNFTPEGGRISIHARVYSNDYLPKTSTNPGILVVVSDNGIGIPREKQSTLFNKFTQVQNLGTFHTTQGTGLGLYIAKGIVEAHGGNIFLQSIPNHGTTISFTLPIAKAIDISPVVKNESFAQIQEQPEVRMVN